ncbi:MAG: cob(I)yrinic acid a,c-diamide adenosyltransferase [Pirellulales bacterium]|nr:cob(I)yrinic acid a,c-diamide adenosyltransferase [Pirellulales bacterium]
MTVYTRSGDRGETDLIGGARVAKDAVRVEACGAVDELNSSLGQVRAEPLPEGIDPLLDQLQHELFALSAELATACTAAAPSALPRLDPSRVESMEATIDRYAAELPPLEGFILPAGPPAAAALHVARTVCRRAERRVVALVRREAGGPSPVLVPYLNRLSDLLFVLARTVCVEAGHRETLWQKDRFVATTGPKE